MSQNDVVWDTPAVAAPPDNSRVVWDTDSNPGGASAPIDEHEAAQNRGYSLLLGPQGAAGVLSKVGGRIVDNAKALPAALNPVPQTNWEKAGEFIGSPARPGEAKCFCDSNKRPGQRRIQRQLQTRGCREPPPASRLLPAKQQLWHGGTSASTALPAEAWAKTPQCMAAANGACRRCGGCHAEQRRRGKLAAGLHQFSIASVRSEMRPE